MYEMIIFLPLREFITSITRIKTSSRKILPQQNEKKSIKYKTCIPSNIKLNYVYQAGIVTIN